MKIEVISKEENIISNWSGGSTSQLYIFPKDSTLQERNFDFRISSAIVEVEESEFTSFAGYDRILMVLNGELEIVHENQYSKTLKQFEIDSFSGDWKTSSKGKIVDFNLILKRGIKGSLKYIDLRRDRLHCRDRSGPVPKMQSVRIIGYYVISGKMEIIVNQDHYLVSEGELIMIENRGDVYTVELKGDCEVIEIFIFL
jgi:environmental stress-induced protein Ves